MRSRIGVIAIAWAAGLLSMPAVADAQGFGRDSQRGSQRGGGAVGGQPSTGGSTPRSSGGFSMQIGPGGVEFGTGGSGQGSQQPHSHGNSFNNPGASGNHHDHEHNPSHNHNNNSWNRPGWNNNPNNWNNNNVWIGPGRPPAVVPPQTVITSPAPPSPPAEPILLVNPAGAQAPVQYRVNQYSYALPPGSTQQLGGDRTWTIDYDRGSNYGRQTYVLTPGRTYRFTPGPRGWELFVVAPDAPPFAAQ